jgi:hypothetical protein
MEVVTDWCTDTGLHLTQEKTEVILVMGKRVPKVLNIDVGNGEITTRNTIRYLSVLMDNARRYSPHLEQVCDKVERFVGAIRNLLPKVNKPTDTVRKLYYGVWKSVVLYAAPIWASVLNMEKNRKILRNAQRAALIRTSTAYRTVSYATLCVVTGSMPIHIKARLHWKEYEVKKGFTAPDRREEENVLGDVQDIMEELKNLKQEAEDKWRLEWTFHNPCNWTRKLIKDPLVFTKRKRRINYYVVQILTGHDIFNHYRYRIGKKSHTSYWDCDDEQDDAKHVLFKCSRWVVERVALETEVGVEFKLENNIVERMVGDDGLWQCFTRFCTRVMMVRQLEEREMEALSG